METPSPARKKVLLLLTREIPALANSGRERTLATIRQSLDRHYDTTIVQIPSVLESRQPVRYARAALRLLRGIASRQHCPLQVALFYDRVDQSPLFRLIEEMNPAAVYFDGVRTVDWLEAVRAKFPQLRLLCDFDDLMSLRYETLLERRLPISLGYLGKHVPNWLRRFIANGVITRAVLAYEAQSLRRAEQRALRVADAVTVVSSTDVRSLRTSCESELAVRTHVLPPGVAFQSPAVRTVGCRNFVFVGSDSLLQNRLTIEYLVGLWATAAPSTPLQIVGRMIHSYPEVAGVTFTGFVTDISSVYDDNCIALCPSFVEGGIKTKVLEALGHGVVPVGNALTFDGMGCDAGALAMSDDELRAFVLDPHARIGELREMASRLRDCIERTYSYDAVARRWSDLVSGGS